ncbi:Phenol hydroxylase P5 protein [uncultured Roseburia sp.]|uniref:FAD/NAD(P)-binding protein n=1 Tax=Brotonthovivens ammoniilytica TaxID=2981725 RepID=A0ABT2TJU1_9FIRM|nr:FAD/NAD(P)-binding protein [Brotonthovivens ammoniilytica]MCU6762475.1 FAD/NAD(P)-binding protein [Brotonthovivens ammoniilytica]SCI72981.1 Phenol hydroxylase P5 protein [uncultured Roseburia sp.]
MSEINHDCTCHGNPLIPQVAKIIKITEETPDVKTFRIQTMDGKMPFDPKPGQLGMISAVGIGEGMFSITAKGEDWIESSIKKVGVLTEALHEMTTGQEIGIRGPYGNHFPYEALKGKDLIFIGGGIGLAPVRSLIRYCLEHRSDYGHIDIVYGSRSPEDLVFKEDLFENWPKEPDTRVEVTVDRGDADWNGNVGFVPAYVEELAFTPENKKVILCGPPIMIKFTSEALLRMGFAKEDVITTLEMRMKCGVGKCGRCNLGGKLICLDGPVFNLAELDELPDEK